PKSVSVFSSPPQAGILADLEVERYLQVDAAIGRRRRVRSPSKTVGPAEQSRTQVADRSGDIDLVEPIPGRDAERQVVTDLVRAASFHAPAAESSSPVRPA